MKIHFDHYKTERDGFQPCLCKFFSFISFKKKKKKNFSIVNGENISARDLLLLCSTEKEQQLWIDKIKKHIPKKNTNKSSSFTFNIIK